LVLRKCFGLFLFFSFLFFAACSFDYGPQDSGDDSQPDIVMNDVEYVRVRDSDPVARFQAERAARYEERRIMELQNFSFEQFGNHGEDVNAYGRAGTAKVELESGDIYLDQGVRIEVDSEDLAIETSRLDWKDKERALLGGPDEAVNILQPNGTSFSGVGFSADARRRTWEFSGAVSGTYIHDDEEEETLVEEEATLEGEELEGEEGEDAEGEGGEALEGEGVENEA
jgi:LPS export ABC transporter protein LptC